MAITMYDLAGTEADRRFSPFCWRTKMALAHKGLAVETVPWRFTEKDKLPTPNDGRVPVIVDGGTGRPRFHRRSPITSKSAMPTGRRCSAARRRAALTHFVQNWTETVLQPGLVRLVVLDI